MHQFLFLDILKSTNLILNELHYSQNSLKIGEYIQKDILDKADKIYGENIVVELSKRLAFEYGRGFSRSNLLRMIQFYKAFKNFKNVATLSRHLS